MDSQPDFREETSILETAIREAGDTFIMYPKYHCKLNFIEQFWGETKKELRRKTSYRLKELRTAVRNSQDNVPVSLIRKHSRRAFRFMDAYRKGLTGVAAAFAVKKYSSHRRIPNQVLLFIDG